MKRFSILFLLSFQILFSQKAHIKGVVNDSGKFPYSGGITVIVNDTIQRLIKHNILVYKSNKEKAKQGEKTINSHLEFDKNQEILNQLRSNRNYVSKADNSGYFAIDAKLTDSLFFESYAHIKEKYLVADLIKKKKISIELKLEPCEVWPSHPEKPSKLYVFVGKKIKVWGSPAGYCNDFFNTRTLAKYEVVQNIYGNYPKKTIEFTSYSHEARIPNHYSPDITNFSQSEYSLLYILKYDGENIQVKYLFNDVYMTNEGKWASPFKPTGAFNIIDTNNLLEPKKIDFIIPIELTYDMRFDTEMKRIFSEKYSRVSNGKIIVTHGLYADDLFKIWKTSRLKDYDYLFKK